MAERNLLSATIRVPENVIYRDFGEETVVLNLDTGMYHGLNPSAASMLERAVAAVTVGDAVPELARLLAMDEKTIEADLATLCDQLRERGLIEITTGSSP